MCSPEVCPISSSSEQGSESLPFVSEITATLVRRFGHPSLGNKRNPFNELLYIILSSKTPPDRYSQVYRELRQVYPRAVNLADADPHDVARVIQSAGLGDKKAAQVVNAARQLERQFGRVTLSPLHSMTDEAAETVLESLPGVGIKSARCILLYSLDRKVFPADNHCLRISQRLGWIENATFSKGTANRLQRAIPPILRRDLHVGMLQLGRRHCSPKNPRCRECPILKYCQTGLSATNP
jgi:endonuclease-3